MAGFDLGGVLGAVLGGGTTRTGRRRSPARGGQDFGRALAILAGVAIEAMSKPSAPPPPPRSGGSWDESRSGGPWGMPPSAPSAKPPPARTMGTRASVPATGSASARPRGKPAPAAPALPPIPPEDRQGLLMLRAMVAAARADGQVDATERAAIAEQLEAAGLGAVARDAVLAEFDRDTPPEALAREVDDPMLAAQLYAAALAGAAGTEASERAWLDGFARALKLDRAATEAIERRMKGE